jgi:hypothetical protein
MNYYLVSMSKLLQLKPKEISSPNSYSHSEESESSNDLGDPSRKLFEV